MTNIEKNQIILSVPVSFAINRDPVVEDLVNDFFQDDGAELYQARKTQPVNGFFIVNRIMYRPFVVQSGDDVEPYAERILNAIAPEWTMLAGQSFDLIDTVADKDGNETKTARVYKSALGADILPFMNDIVETDEEGNEISRTRPTIAYLEPPCDGASEWEFLVG